MEATPIADEWGAAFCCDSAAVETIMSWDDSAAWEALELCRKRKRAKELGLSYNIPAPRPDLYNQEIDWSAGSTSMSPEVAEAWRCIQDRDSSSSSSSSSRRGRRGRNRKAERSAAQPKPEQCKTVSGWDQEEVIPTGWGELPQPEQHPQVECGNASRARNSYSQSRMQHGHRANYWRER